MKERKNYEGIKMYKNIKNMLKQILRKNNKDQEI